VLVNVNFVPEFFVFTSLWHILLTSHFTLMPTTNTNVVTSIKKVFKEQFQDNYIVT